MIRSSEFRRNYAIIFNGDYELEDDIIIHLEAVTPNKKIIAYTFFCNFCMYESRENNTINF